MIRHSNIPCFVLLFLLFSSSSQLDAQTATFTFELSPGRDNTLYSENANASNGDGDWLFVGKTGLGDLRRALLFFDVAGSIPAGATISSVELRLEMDKTVSGDQILDLHRLNADWGEGTSDAGNPGGQGDAADPGDATWTCSFHDGLSACTTSWTSAGGDFSTTVSASQTVGGNGNYTWGSTAQLIADVQDMLDNPTTNFGWILKHTDELINSSAKRFRSRQNTSLPPVLAVTFTVPTLSAEIAADRDNTLYEENGNASNGLGNWFFSGNTRSNEGNHSRRGILRFDIAGNIPAGAIITNVQLSLQMDQGSGGTKVINLNRLTADWGEGTSKAADPEETGAAATVNDASWSCRFHNGSSGCTTAWTTAGGDFAPTASASQNVTGPGNYLWGPTPQLVADVQTMLSTPSTNFGWILQHADEVTANTLKRFQSRHNPGTPPRLLVTYTIAFPVELVRFEGSAREGGIDLKWETASEINNELFTVERSASGKDFQAIGKVPGAGSSDQSVRYAYFDRTPVEGINYYRLKQTDFDGSFSYSEIISVHYQEAVDAAVNIWPNPFSRELNIAIAAYREGDISLRIYDLSGRLLLHQHQRLPIGQSLIQPDLRDLSSGIYLVRIFGSNGLDTSSLVRKE